MSTKQLRRCRSAPSDGAGRVGSATSAPTPDQSVARRFLDAHFVGVVDSKGALPATSSSPTASRSTPTGALPSTSRFDVDRDRKQRHDADFHLALHDFDRRLASSRPPARKASRSAGTTDADGCHVSFFRGLLEPQSRFRGLARYRLRVRRHEKTAPADAAARHLIEQVVSGWCLADLVISTVVLPRLLVLPRAVDP